VEWRGRVTKPKVGSVNAIRDVKAPKRLYSAPAFEVVDINGAKAQLETKATAEDASVRQMLSSINKRLEEKKSAPNSAFINPVS